MKKHGTNFVSSGNGKGLNKGYGKSKALSYEITRERANVDGEEVAIRGRTELMCAERLTQDSKRQRWSRQNQDRERDLERRTEGERNLSLIPQTRNLCGLLTHHPHVIL